MDSMDDPKTFGRLLYRRSYADAIKNGWLTDYRIIAFAVTDDQGVELANKMAEGTKYKSARLTSLWLRALGLGLALSGGVGRLRGIGSCLGFLNTVARSKAVAEELSSDKGWAGIKRWNRSVLREQNREANCAVLATVKRSWNRWALREQNREAEPTRFEITHLDARSPLRTRKAALDRLEEGTVKKPQAIVNVGIFGEGTDTPALDAVAFLEARKSPIEVIQAVGRAMRLSEGKEHSYIICPITMPTDVDAEAWLARSNGEGWETLGQILLALRAHDGRIEDRIADLLEICVPTGGGRPPTERTLVVTEKDPRSYLIHQGTQKDLMDGLHADGEPAWDKSIQTIKADCQLPEEVHQIIVVESNQPRQDGHRSIVLREGSVKYTKPKAGHGSRIDQQGTWKEVRRLQEGRSGRILPEGVITTRRRDKGDSDSPLQKLDLRTESGKAIRLNVLQQSGLRPDRGDQDANVLREAVKRAAKHLKEDELEETLAALLGMDQLQEDYLKEAADPCTLSALLILNALLLQRRLETRSSRPGWMKSNWIDLTRWPSLSDSAVIDAARSTWRQTLKQDYFPIVRPALDVVQAVAEHTGRTAGIGQALRASAEVATEIAESYARIGMDHAGPLLNGVMGDRRSDGAFFTRPTAAMILASLALDAYGPIDWTDKADRAKVRTLDPACGSGTLLTAMAERMGAALRKAGGNDDAVEDLHKQAVEHLLTGLDINRISLQMAAGQLALRNTRIEFERMNLYQMPYGPRQDLAGADAGTLELFATNEFWGQGPVPKVQENMFRDPARAERTSSGKTQIDLASIATQIKRQGVVITNPPFTSRNRMGLKFVDHRMKRLLAKRVDHLDHRAGREDPAFKRVSDKNSVRPLFVALADRCLDRERGVLAMVCPTAPMMTGPAGIYERKMLSRRFHVHTILTCHAPHSINMSDSTNIHESLVICRRHRPGNRDRPTRIIALDRFPQTRADGRSLEAMELCEALQADRLDGWGEVSHWPRDRIAAGNWAGAIWRNPELAEAAEAIEASEALVGLEGWKAPGSIEIFATGQSLRGAFRRAEAGDDHTLEIFKSKAGTTATAQRCLQGIPDEVWTPKARNRAGDSLKRMERKAGHLLLTAGQATDSGRLTALVSVEPRVGNSWMPVGGLNLQEAKALAVWLNSSYGRLLLLRRRGKKLTFPVYSATEARSVKVPRGQGWIPALVDAYERTRNLPVPRYDAGECRVRELWDVAVESAIQLDLPVPAATLRTWLNAEPSTTGRRYRAGAASSGPRFAA